MISDDARGAVEAKPLRVGIVVDGPTPPRWIAELATALEAAPHVDLAVVIVSRPSPRRPGLLIRLFDALEQRLFASDDDPFLPSSRGLPPATWVELDDPSSGASLSAAQLDLVLHLGEGRPPPHVLDDASPEVWWFDRAGQPPYLGDLIRGTPVTTTLLLGRSRSADQDTILARWVTRAEPGSWRRTRALAYRQSSELAVASLRQLGSGRLVTLPTQTPATSGKAVRGLFAPRIITRALKRRIQWQRYEEQWLLAVRARRSPAAYPIDTEGFTPVVPPRDRSWADPFLAVSDGGVRYVFFEDQPHDTRRAVISYAEIDANGLRTPSSIALERPYHLSYPLVFRKGNSWFLLPESSENRTVELYRATRFPAAWELDRVLLEGVHATDATPLEYQGRTWIFVSSETSTGYPTEAVSLFWATTLTGQWHAHPLNPVVSDVRASRPGGRIISRDGRLFRPAQDGSRGYGCGLVFMEITRLTPTEYEETPVCRMSADWLVGAIGTHHYDADDAVEVIDVQRRIRRRTRPRTR